MALRRARSSHSAERASNVAPAADCRAVHGGNNGLLATKNPQCFLVKMLNRATPAFAGHTGIRTVGEVGAGAEGGALGGQHNGAAVHIGIKRFERIGDLIDQQHVEKIMRRAADFDQPNMIGQRN